VLTFSECLHLYIADTTSHLGQYLCTTAATRDTDISKLKQSYGNCRILQDEIAVIQTSVTGTRININTAF